MRYIRFTSLILSVATFASLSACGNRLDERAEERNDSIRHLDSLAAIQYQRELERQASQQVVPPSQAPSSHETSVATEELYLKGPHPHRITQP